MKHYIIPEAMLAQAVERNLKIVNAAVKVERS